MEVQHVVAQHLSELTEHLLMPRVVLQIDLGLDLNDTVEEQHFSVNIGGEEPPDTTVSGFLLTLP